MSGQHDPEQLAAYAVGLLPAQDMRGTEAHLSGCPDCQLELSQLREVDAGLRQAPPELFLDGPPPGADLVLQRTLRRVRQERGGQAEQFSVEPSPVRDRDRQRRQRLTLVAAALVAVLGSGAVGVALGQSHHDQPIAASPITPPVAGSRVLTGVNPASGARMTVTLVPNAGWVGIKASIVGLPVHERCMLVVLDRGGTPFIVGSWVVPAPEVGEEYTADAGAAVALADVSAVEVQSLDGQPLVVAPA